MPMAPLLARELERLNFSRRIPEQSTWRILHGDAAGGARGEVLVVA